MADAADRPQIYLVTPPDADAQQFPDRLAAVLDAVEVACVRLTLGSSDADHVARVADALRGIAHDRDVAIVIEAHVAMVERLGLDGVHLNDGARSIRKVRADLGADAIVGTYCGTSRHDGMTAVEIGADYVSFGPVGETVLGDGTRVEREVFEWWSEIIELPVVAEGALTEALIADLAPVTDWFAFRDEVWSAEDPIATLKRLVAAMG
ncbi:thiamine phosphate synthase [Anianabacter salinae]|uniref:thiamine phosphate synthase n=1 Tax=Anianabacter salinae TaxID=2851023 RepID=UPI00225DEA87|nr:thiamine phosphate synthase [Anianabacter salinae]MBV0911959.1 thiamine phosphate synthase [Anianabacter salinae]